MHQLASLQLLIRTFNWHTPSWDLFIILFWLVASVIYAFAAGRGRILTILMSVYMSKLLVIQAPFLSAEVGKKLPGATLSMQQLVTFLLLFIILFIFLGRYAFKTSADGRKITSVGFGIIFAFLQVGLLINIIIGFLPVVYQDTFAPLIQTLFIKNPAGFIWLVLPVLFLIFLGRFISERSEM
jgi:hypothetical protein